MIAFFTALVAILDEALACHELLPSQVQQFEITAMPSGLKACFVILDENYYAEIVLLDGTPLYSSHGRYDCTCGLCVVCQHRLLTLNEQKAQEDGQDAEFYNLMAEAQ